MFRKFRVQYFIIVLSCMLFISSCSIFQAGENKPAEIDNFSFIHLSDSHVSPHFSMPGSWDRLRSYRCIRSIPDVGETPLEAFSVTAPKPSFIIDTGDTTEYGYAGKTWDVVQKYFENVTMPIYRVPGNHDNTWVTDTGIYRENYGGVNHSFDYGGCHFVGIASATFQDPVPSFGEEVIQFLKQDLEKIDRKTPVFVYFHHPLNSGSFCSQYDVDRVLDVLRTRNTVLVMDGHGHQSRPHDYWGVDGVEGGSTFSKKDPPKDGYNIVYLKDGEICVSYRKYIEKTARSFILKKQIPSSCPFPQIEILSPTKNKTVKTEAFAAELKIRSNDIKITKARYNIDGEMEGEMTVKAKKAISEISTDNLCNGAHFIRFTLEDENGEKYYRSCEFIIERNNRTDEAGALWRFQMKGASKASPLVTEKAVYAGANDGVFYALDKKTGQLIWTFDAGAEILTSAKKSHGLILFAAGNGKFFALKPDGTMKWSYQHPCAIYASPVTDEDTVYAGANDAAVIALDIETGKKKWQNNEARYSVESSPFVTGEHIYYGAWDGYVYCLDKNNGNTLWKKPGPRNQDRVIRYYGPADDSPIVAGNALYITDRGYTLGKYGLNGEYKAKLAGGCSAIGCSENSDAMYLRFYKDPLIKIDLEGETIWESDVVCGRVPVSPLEKNGKLYVCTNSGRLHVINAETGETMKQYQATPKLYVMSRPSVENDIVYVTGMDGSLTAIDTGE